MLFIAGARRKNQTELKCITNNLLTVKSGGLWLLSGKIVSNAY